MTFETVIMLLVTVRLMVYQIYSLMRPEKF
jgi:K+-transporting ATPase KdpF subunit